MKSGNNLGSAFGRRARLFECITRGEIGAEVLAELLPSGEGLLYEKALWDYKAELPTLPTERRPSDTEKETYALKMAEIVKDVVSFYNSYGGYIVAGVDDKSRKVTGFSGLFDTGDLAKKVHAATRHEIDCHWVVHEVPAAEGVKPIGVLFIPRRSYAKSPAQFLRDAPANASGKQAYRANQIYLRLGDECRAAQNSEDYSFLCAGGRREFSFAEEFRRSRVLTNNLGPRDPGFITFVGRETYLRSLWRWVCDGFAPVKLLAGIGGVGKTTLAREFAEDFVRNPPMGFDKLVWLSAKRRFYTAILGRYQTTSRVDFSDLRTLLLAVLSELGYASNNIDPAWTDQELIEECVLALRMFPSILVIDDVDSLEPMQQQEVFQAIIQIVAQTVGRSGSIPSLALLTARLDLGAAPGQLIRVAGLELDDFAEYTALTVQALGIPLSLKSNSTLMKTFHTVTDGSPTFAASILSLLPNGDHLDVALRKWKGADGDEVRNFAFKNELDKLSESQIRTLYAACLLGDTSFVELQGILQSNDRLLNNDIGQLRKYHLVAFGEDLPGGARIVIPSTLQLVTELIQERIRDPKYIERECLKAKAGTPRIQSEVGEVIRRVTALWREKRIVEALDLVRVADRKQPNDPDLKCLLGRAYLILEPPSADEAEVALHKAFELKCQRPELPTLWLKAKMLLEDWMGLIEVTQLFPDNAEMILARAQAYAQIGNLAAASRNLRRAADQWLLGGREVDQAFKTMKARGRENELKYLGRWLFEHHVQALDALTRDQGQRIDVWAAVVEAFNCYVRYASIISLGVEALAQWWTAVEQRKPHDLRAKHLMQTQLRKLDGIIGEIVTQQEPNKDLLAFLNKSRTSLQERTNRYASKHV